MQISLSRTALSRVVVPNPQPAPATPTGDTVLLENGSRVLLENGSYLLLE